MSNKKISDVAAEILGKKEGKTKQEAKVEILDAAEEVKEKKIIELIDNLKDKLEITNLSLEGYLKET